jgi:ABC-type nitrate/sulfonate/bicarbonate transport system substrate-binding protein
MARKGMLLAMLMVSYLVVSLTGTALSQTKVRLGYGRFTNELVYVAMDKGLYKKHGVEVKFVGFPSLGRIPQVMAAGEIDMGVFTVPAFLISVEKGVKVVAVATIMGMSNPPVPYVAMESTGIKKIEDLRGKTIAISTFGGNFDLYLRYMLEKHGLDPKKDVTIVEMPLPQTLKAVTSRRVDAGVLTSTYYIVGKDKYGDRLRRIFDFKDVDPIKGLQWVSLLLGAKKDFLADNKESVKRVLKGHLEAVKFYKDDFKEAIKVVSKFLKSPAMKKSRPFDIPYDAKIDLRSIQTDIGLMVNFGYIKRPFKAEEVVDNSLLDELTKESR